MFRNRLFFFTDPHNFSFPLIVKILFKLDRGEYINRFTKQHWHKKVYNYYGEYVDAIAKYDEPSFIDLVEMFRNSTDDDTIFGVLNELMNRYKEQFLRWLKGSQDIVPARGLEIFNGYF